ncbi:LysR substrate-binding domain-containing protein [Mesorhizobium sp. M1329]|uniref:LysR substrate-binding domain-containing protein n=1 Tax=Mesorhizobium sp. M1329 TaxID=2957083 RepID=UPI00333B2864
MRKKLPTASWLCAFEATARHCSMTRAADELNISHSAVSQQIKSLEQYLGANLFSRTPKGIVLSESGRYYMPLVAEAITLLHRGTMTFLASGRRIKLNVAANFSFALLWLIPKLKGFRQTHPNVDVSISSMLWPHEFDGSDAQIKIRYGRGRWSDGAYHKLTDDRLFPVCAPGVAQSIGKIEDLFSQTLIDVTGTPSTWDTWLAAMGLADAPPAVGQVQVNNFSSSMELAKRGHGIALGHETVAHEALASGCLVIPLRSDVISREQYYASVNPNDGSKRIVMEFMTWMGEELKLHHVASQKHAVSSLLGPNLHGVGS